LFGGLTELEVLARVGGLPQTEPHDIVQTTFGGSEEAWKKSLHDGFVETGAVKPSAATFVPTALAPALASLSATAPTKENLEVVFAHDNKMDDGRWANNAWLMEMPDPITKIVWDNAVLVSRKTAEDLGVKNKQLVDINL